MWIVVELIYIVEAEWCIAAYFCVSCFVRCFWYFFAWQRAQSTPFGIEEMSYTQRAKYIQGKVRNGQSTINLLLEMNFLLHSRNGGKPQSKNGAEKLN
jgi:hypothetical protein